MRRASGRWLCIFLLSVATGCGGRVSSSPVVDGGQGQADSHLGGNDTGSSSAADVHADSSGGASDTGAGGGDDSSDAGADSSDAASDVTVDAAPRTATYPVAPSVGNFMWQGVQDQFLDQDKQPCKAHVTLAAGDQATCFVGANGHLYCAGQIDVHDYGSTFTDTGIAGVEQILMSPTSNSANHDSICVALGGGGGECWGSDNDHGEFADGSQNGSTTPVSWGGISNLYRLATGTWSSICAITTTGEVDCAGYDFGATAVPQAGQHQSMFVDVSGNVNFDSTTVLRVINSRATCQVTTNGYECVFPQATFGAPGTVVDGTAQGIAANRACWLTNDGKVSCASWGGLPLPGPTPSSSMPTFAAMPVLALAGNFYSDAICAVYSDGSLSCLGRNDHGQLGTGDTNYVSTETIVAPPGTIDVTCK